MAKKAAYRRKRHNKFSMFLTSVVILMLLLVVAVKSNELEEKKAYYQQKEESLEKQIAAEKERAQEIDEYETYTQTKKYIEDVAKEKLGLIYDGEIVFKDEND